jgi:hypothetical protein
MNNTALAIIQSEELETIQRTGRLLAASGYFDAKGEGNQAIAMMATKIIAGREMGIGPFASVNGVHIIQGKPSVGANLMAAAVKGSGRYDYRVREMTNDVCKIEFLQRNGDKLESLGISEFTKSDAIKAKTQNMDKFPRNMLFARAMSNGVRWYCPDIFSGNVVYVPEELGADVDEDGNVVDASFTVTAQDAPQQAQRSLAVDPYHEPRPTTQRATVEPDGDVIFQVDRPILPTDEELDILGTWQTPEDAQVWAVNTGACANKFEAKNSFKNEVNKAGGRLTKENLNAVLLAFLRKQMVKLDKVAA